MRILHYSLGLPPYRTGGLTKYSLDLMKEQISMGHAVCLLYPGHFSIFNKHIKICKNKQQFEIKVYELINPLPVSLLGGIRQPSNFYKTAQIDRYMDFLKKLKPDIIHVHTFMGIHKEFFVAAKELNIRIVFTTHDYFGICPKVNFIDYKNHICNEYDLGGKCIKCNHNAYGMKLIFMMQSRLYRYFKNSNFILKLRSYIKTRLRKKENKKSMNLPCSSSIEYVKLRRYYLGIFNLIDYFHFNSFVAKEQYEKYMNCMGEVINITHSHIKDNRKLKDFRDSSSKLRITYLGPADVYKGVNLLVETLEELRQKNISNWKLSIYGNNTEITHCINEEYYAFNGVYNYSQLKDICYSTDILIIPSIWKETFGYIGLEALSYGVPVMVTENVGFKDMLCDNLTGLITKPNKEELALNLQLIIEDRSILKRINKNIIEAKFDFSMESHVEKIIQLYNKVLEGGC
jgi:glycosyltransferase involved in cell wall biosynthesis